MAEESERWPDTVISDNAARVVQHIARAAGERIAALKWSLRAVEAATGVSRMAVAALIEGSSWPDVQTVVRLEVGLNCRLWPASTRLMSRHAIDRPAAPGDRIWEMSLRRVYFDLVASGRKSIEVRVCYPKLDGLGAGDRIRFMCGGDDCLTRVARVAVYTSFEEMIDAEGAENVNPDLSRDQQLADIRDIYGPEKEALGVMAVEVVCDSDPIALRPAES
jgi:ASC-1-like (ASCH) protein